MDDLAILVAGMLLAALGGEVFVRGSVGLGRYLRIPAGIIGVTIAAFATSSPEVAVGVNAALAGTPEISVGDALGSNVVNVALVMGVVLAAGPLVLVRRDVQRDLPFAIGAPLLVALLCVDGQLSRIDGLVLLLVFFVWIGTAVRQAFRSLEPVSHVLGVTGPRASMLFTASGIIILLLAGRLVVIAAEGIGETLRLDPFIVGATMVALGTSMPELATATVARVRGHDDLGVGTVIGSNIFNSLLIVGGVAVIDPFALRVSEIVVAVLAGAFAASLLIPSRGWTLGRGRGVVLLSGYIAYIGLLIVIADR